MFKNLITKISKLYQSAETIFVVAFTMFIGCATIYTIIIRTLGMQSFRWLDEMGRTMLIITTLIGASMAVTKEGHMSVDTLYAFLSKRVAFLLKSITSLICGAFYIYLFYYTVNFTMLQARLNRTMESLLVPIYITWIFISIAIVTMGARYIIQSFRNLKRFIYNDVPIEDSNLSLERADDVQ